VNKEKTSNRVRNVPQANDRFAQPAFAAPVATPSPVPRPAAAPAITAMAEAADVLAPARASPLALAPPVALGPRATEAIETNETGDSLDRFFLTAEERESIGEALVSAGTDASSTAGRTLMELLAFGVADEEYAIEIVAIQEIIKVPSITEVPRGPTGVLGIISLRGAIVPVVDLRAVLRLDQSPITAQSRILVIRAGGDAAGLLVDRVTSVVRIDRTAIESVPRTMKHGASELLRGVGHVGDRMLIVLDLAAVVAGMEAAA